MIVFTSPQAASGKSVLAANLAFELAKTRKVCLVDADFVHPSQHIYFGIKQAPASLNALCRLIEQGRFGEGDFEKLTLELAVPDASVTLVAGSLQNSITRQSFETLIEYLNLKYEVVILDLAIGDSSCRELEEVALNRSDTILATCLADAVSVSRFISDLESFSQIADFEKVQLVVNRTRETVLGRNPEGQLSETLRSHTPFRNLAFIPEDPAFDQAMLKSIPLAYTSKKSAARLALADLAAKLVHTG